MPPHNIFQKSVCLPPLHLIRRLQKSIHPNDRCEKVIAPLPHSAPRVIFQLILAIPLMSKHRTEYSGHNSETTKEIFEKL